MDNKQFDFFSNRLTFIDITPDKLLNVNLCHHLSVFESYVYGVASQYSRIKDDLDFSNIDDSVKVPLSQASLDIYYYILCWDKLKKIYEEIKRLVNLINQSPTPLPEKFNEEFREWKRRIEHLFLEYSDEVRNEYEHPSLEFYSIGNIQMWGNISTDSSGNIKAHAGKDCFASIKKEHTDRIYHLRIDLFDLFLKYFSKKQLTKELIKVRDFVYSNIEAISKDLQEFKTKKDWDNFNSLFKEIINIELYLSKEGIQLSNEIRDKIFSLFY
jgi:hypothetical protein